MRYSIFPLRLGLGIVFLMLGIDKLVNTSTYLMQISRFNFISGDFEGLKSFVLCIGIFELAIAILFIIGFFTRFVALLTTISLCVGLFLSWSTFGTLPYEEIGFLGMSVSLLISGAGDKSLDRFFLKKTYNTN